MFNYKHIILLITLVLFSCTKNSNSNQHNYNKKLESRNLFSIVKSYPNKDKSISYSFFNDNSFDFSLSVNLILSQTENGVDGTIIESICKWDVFNCEIRKIKKIFSKDDRLDYFIEKLSHINRDTCYVYDSFLRNSKINSTIMIANNGAVYAIPYVGTRCSYERQEKEKTRLEKLDFELRKYYMEIGAWDNLIVNSSSINKELKEKKIIDTMYFERFNLDYRVTKKKNIFYPLNPFTYSGANAFIPNIDSMPYYKADLEGDSILYIWNKSENGKIVLFKDNDTTSFFDIIKNLSLYEKEEWIVFRKGCPQETESNYIYWNDSSLNIIAFECINEKLKIWDLNRKVREWLESKFSGK